jgi:hypothetical protein
MPLPVICRETRFEPPHRHNADEMGVSFAFGTATDPRMLRFEKCEKPAWNGRCGVVADRNLPFERRALQPPGDQSMPSSFEPVTRSCFERRMPDGKLDLIFKVAFGIDAAAARYLRVSRMSIWRWRHDRAPIPAWVMKVLSDRLRDKVAEAQAAQGKLQYMQALPPKPHRPLSGCCAGLHRKIKKDVSYA